MVLPLQPTPGNGEELNRWSIQVITGISMNWWPEWITHGGTKESAYMGRDRHVYELMMDTNGTWSHTDLTQHMRAPDANNGVLVGHEWSSQFAKHIVYLDTRENPHIHSLMLLHGNPWQHRDLTDLTGAQSIV